MKALPAASTARLGSDGPVVRSPSMVASGADSTPVVVSMVRRKKFAPSGRASNTHTREPTAKIARGSWPSDRAGPEPGPPATVVIAPAAAHADGAGMTETATTNDTPAATASPGCRIVFRTNTDITLIPDPRGRVRRAG